MYALDFEYDGQYLSDFGFMICNFDGASGVQIAEAGSRITFNTVPRQSGKKYGLIGTQYEECYKSTFDICKKHDSENIYIGPDEFRELFRWLNRREYLKFGIVDTDPSVCVCYYNASFNVSKITVADKLCGLRLEMETDSPFGYGDIITHNITLAGSSSYTLTDKSDEVGELFPKVQITCQQSGDLTITNSMMKSPVVIKNCANGEVITLSGDTQIITTSLSSHKIYNDFNFVFFKIANKYDTRSNTISANLRCNIKIEYVPIIKDSLS